MRWTILFLLMAVAAVSGCKTAASPPVANSTPVPTATAVRPDVSVSVLELNASWRISSGDRWPLKLWAAVVRIQNNTDEAVVLKRDDFEYWFFIAPEIVIAGAGSACRIGRDPTAWECGVPGGIEREGITSYTIEPGTTREARVQFWGETTFVDGRGDCVCLESSPSKLIVRCDRSKRVHVWRPGTFTHINNAVIDPDSPWRLVVD